MNTLDMSFATQSTDTPADSTNVPGSPPVDGLQRFEKIPCRVFRDAGEASRTIAGEIAALIRTRAVEGRRCVLGLATGSTPVGVYAELVRMHQDEGLSFRNVVTFNLDEYYPMQPAELQSYVRFMREHLFDLVDVEPASIHIPDGTLPEDQVDDFCRRYEQEIAAAGGIDLQILGIGRTGHIGFNEPGSGRDSQTRLITLDRVTRRDAASDFFDESHVPRRAITMGVGTILAARQVVLLAFGEGKSGVVARAIEGEISPSIAASFLQTHPRAEFVIDDAAADALVRRSSPWLAGNVTWDESLIRKAVIWLAQRVKKPILKLTEEDYNEEGLQDLLASCGTAYGINLDVFRQLQRTITGWPGGKPAHLRRPGDLVADGSEIYPKRVVVFSPHPDDDVISMGGTLIRLVEQGHYLHIAYQTSGNIAVSDDDAVRFMDFAGEFNRQFGIDQTRTAELESHIEEFVTKKQPGQIDSPEVQDIKGMIRRSEARAALRSCNVPEGRLHFLNMPFYETGRVRKKPLSEEDVQIIVDLLRCLEPHQIYAAGDLSDPHGTHRTCLAALTEACRRVQSDPWYQHCVVWLYRGAWQEWGPHQIEMAVPLSPQELIRKREAIFKHQSQKDKALFPGPDPREFWQRAEQRNRSTAELYDRLGLAEYEAIEGFVSWTGE